MVAENNAKRNASQQNSPCNNSIAPAKTGLHKNRKSAPPAEGQDWPNTFIDKWLYRFDRILMCQLDALRDHLESEDERTRDNAAKEIHEILGWLYQPPGPLSDEEKWRKTLNAIKDQTISVQGRLAAVRRVARSTGRPRGRPRTDTAQHAIHSLSLHFATSLSWREIALKVKGCSHRRPNPEQRSCRHCGDAIRDAAGRFEKFLLSKGYHPKFPRRVELERMSHTDLKRLFDTTLTDSDE